jgi:dTDP-4-dehydrorhamnose reductase
LVTGGSGQLVRALAEVGPRYGIEIVTVGRPHLDLARINTIESAIVRASPQLVINAAAYTAVDRAESEPELADAVNATGAGVVAQTCSRLDISVIQISTDYVFDGRLTSPYTETDVATPQSAYGLSKLEGEKRVAAACPKHIILRTAWVYSAWGQNFVKTMLRMAESRSSIGVVDDQIGSPTYAVHLADVSLAIASRLSGDMRNLNPWGIYHAAGAGEATWCAFAREIFRCAAELGGPVAEVKAITTGEYPTPAKRPANSRLSSNKLQTLFGVRLPDWRIGTRECVRRLLAEGARK